jgi:hypothetical protein
MTNQQHPITPPPTLINQWLGEFFGCIVNGGIADSDRYLATKAARWGADQELEECCEYLTSRAAWEPEDVRELFNHRRPKPQSLNDIALQMLGTIERDAHYLPEITDTIRNALEALPND